MIILQFEAFMLLFGYKTFIFTSKQSIINVKSKTFKINKNMNLYKFAR